MRLNDLINKELGRYRVEMLIGRGGMAAVYRAFDTRLHRHVALKVLYPQYLADADIVERFRREAITAAQLDHPHIAPIFDVGEADGLSYLAMKLLPGPSLAEVLQHEQRLSPDRAVALAYEIAAALDEAHGCGIIHRDIKPGNVLFDERGRAILTDFGIAKSLDAPSLTESSVIVGTPDYIAPEQIDPRLAPDGKIDHRADLYSLGAMLYRTLTGRRPFEGPSQTVLLAQLRDDPAPPSTVAPDLPSAVDAVLAKAMAKQPQDRYFSAVEMAQALSAALAEILGEATAVGTIFPPTALRHTPYIRSTARDVDQPAALASTVPAAEQAAEPPANSSHAVRRRWLLVPLLIGALFLSAAGALAVQFVQIPTVGTGGATVIAAGAATTTATAMLTTTTQPSPTSQATARATATPLATAVPTLTSVLPTPTAQPTASRAPVAGGGSGIVSQPVPTRPVFRPTAQPTQRPTERPPSAPTKTPVPPPPQPTPTAALPPCGIELAGGFGNLWRTNAAVRNGIGCPTEPERAGYSVEQLFEGGAMYYRDDSKQYWVFSNKSGTWRLYTDVYESDPEPTDEPPPGLFRPVRGFGRLWQKYPTIREALGWATTPEDGFGDGVIERFENGSMIYAPAANGHTAQIYVLYNTGTFDIFKDTYSGP